MSDLGDPVSKAILIIKSSPKSLQTAEAFLRNRDWVIFSTTNLKEALNFLVEHKPPFVMVSADHTARKVRVLPKILIQAFPVCVISFVEQASTASYRLLMEAATEYKVNPPVSGPAIERTINRYIRDQERITEEAEAAAANDAASAAHLQALARLKSIKALESEEPESLEARNTEDFSSDAPEQALTQPNEIWARMNQDSLVVGREIDEEELPSVIGEGAQKALDETAEIGDGVIHEAVETAADVACITIESTRFAGYLVAALGKDRKIDDEFIEGIRGRLIKFLADNGEVLNHEEKLSLKIKPVNFQGWALQYADFLRKSVHRGNEVAMAFFPSKKVKSEVGESASSDMVSIQLEEIQVDVPLEFNLYLYMPVNNKYVLYTPKGSKLYQPQKNRMEVQGVKNVHILKSEVQDLSRFRVQNHLNTMIDQFQANQPKSDPSQSDQKESDQSQSDQTKDLKKKLA